MQTKTKRLTESAMLLAIAIVLELVSKMFIPEMPFGGQITLVSMLPVVLISYRHGVKWGLWAGVAYAAMEMLLGAKTVAAAFQPGYFGDGTMIGNAKQYLNTEELFAWTLTVIVLSLLLEFLAVALLNRWDKKYAKQEVADAEH